MSKGCIKSAIEDALMDKSARFFTPGHKGKGRYVDSLLLKDDVTEIKGTDNLHAPMGAIAAAQQNTARIFGSSHTFYLVNGSTAGIYAMLGAVCPRGSSIIVDRCCHYSVINAITLLGLDPIYIFPRYNEDFGIYSHIAHEDISDIVKKNPHARAVFITSPTYYGSCSDVGRIAAIAHNHSMPLLVDQAHGAHFAFSNELPTDAVTEGADCVVMSAHKTLPCLTQGAYLHVRSSYINVGIIQEQLRFFQTSSPSYLILSSLEKAAIVMDEQAEALTRLVCRCVSIRRKAEKTGKITCFITEVYDKTRIVLNFSKIGATGHEISVLLSKRGVYAEMAEGYNLVFIATISNTQQDFIRLAKGLEEAVKHYSLTPKRDCGSVMQLPRAVCLPWDAYNAEHEVLSASDAVGRIAARAMFKAPPGIPLVCPGEIVPSWLPDMCDEEIAVIMASLK